MGKIVEQIYTDKPANMKWKRLLMLAAGLLFTAKAYGTSLEPADFPSLTSSLKAIDSLEFCGEQVPLEVQEVRERFEKEVLLSLWDRPQVILWLKRSRRYIPHIEKMLKESGMPDDLKYIAIAESALRPHAGSRKGAVGFWQFLPDTGQRNGLVINELVDERRNVFASTRAAIRYFKELRKTFGSWSLAVAAFNMGEEGLMAEILEQETNNYYSLYLPLETQRFIFRILSVKLILSDPEKYGFKLTEEDRYPPLVFDEMQFDCFQEIPIRIVAKAAKTHFKVIKDLNPEIRGHYLAAGSHNILIPKGASEGFEDRYRRLEKEFLEVRKGRIYIIKKGDSLSSIAHKFDVPIASLIIWNRIDLSRPIHPGDRLIIYPKNIQSDRTSQP
jgi:membrane-bound lytic murein transglycosylase D